MKKKRFPLHPFLFAIFPVLALLGHNISEVTIDVILRPAIIVLTVTLILFLLSTLVLRDAQKASLVITLFLVLFFTYGQVYNFMRENPVVPASLARHRYLLVLYAGLFILGLVAILRGKRNYQKINQALNLVGMLLLIFPVYQIARYEIAKPAGQAMAESWVPQVSLSVASAQGSRPDVYYIILDGYSRADVIQEQVGYDNTPFLNQLRDLGFVIGDCSRSNYGSTHSSLTSSLNMEELSTVVQWAANEGLSGDQVWDFIIHSQVRKQFENLGYKIVAFDTGYAWLDLTDADLFLSLKTTPLGVQWITPFEKMLLDSSLASVYMDWRSQTFQNQFSESNHPESYFINKEEFKLTELPKIADIGDPTFTYAHILIPHVPYVFSPEGLLTDLGFFTGKYRSPINEKFSREGYIDEIGYANLQIISIVNYILKHSSTPPIIVLQGDHGFGPDRFPILNAYYLPGEGSQMVYPTISPVNTFRLIFDTYFGGSYDLLPDISYAGEKSDQPVPEMNQYCQQ
ncbi:MAG: hypothetical protein M1281_16670 [Chloroflexi bacterium]|nr:hypothetical protein [Chloroflexota bacterium]